jgi:uncharacterized membrane protein
MIDPTHLHPMVVHFPIALIVVGFFSDLIGVLLKRDFFLRAGLYLLLLGTAGVVAAYFSGDFAGEGLAEGGALKQALETHESAATFSLWVMVATVLVRITLLATKKFTGVLRWIPISFFLLGVLSIARTGFYGGQLVYKHAAGVSISIEGIGSSGEEPASEQVKTNEDKD